MSFDDDVFQVQVYSNSSELFNRFRGGHWAATSNYADPHPQYIGIYSRDDISALPTTDNQGLAAIDFLQAYVDNSLEGRYNIAEGTLQLRYTHPKWELVLPTISQLPFWTEVKSLTYTNLRVNAAMMYLIASVGTFQSLPLFQLFTHEFITECQAASATLFNADDIAAIGQALDSCNFDPTVILADFIAAPRSST